MIIKKFSYLQTESIDSIPVFGPRNNNNDDDSTKTLITSNEYESLLGWLSGVHIHQEENKNELVEILESSDANIESLANSNDDIILYVDMPSGNDDRSEEDRKIRKNQEAIVTNIEDSNSKYFIKVITTEDINNAKNEIIYTNAEKGDPNIIGFKRAAYLLNNSSISINKGKIKKSSDFVEAKLDSNNNPLDKTDDSLDEIIERIKNISPNSSIKLQKNKFYSINADGGDPENTNEYFTFHHSTERNSRSDDFYEVKSNKYVRVIDTSSILTPLAEVNSFKKINTTSYWL